METFADNINKHFPLHEYRIIYKRVSQILSRNSETETFRFADSQINANKRVRHRH